MSMGNLEDLNLGMGLRASASQFIPAQHAGLDGWTAFAGSGNNKKWALLIFSALLLIGLVYKLKR